MITNACHIVFFLHDFKLFKVLKFSVSQFNFSEMLFLFIHTWDILYTCMYTYSIVRMRDQIRIYTRKSSQLCYKTIFKTNTPSKTAIHIFQGLPVQCIVFVKSLIPYTFHNFLGNLKIDLILNCLTSKQQKARVGRNADVQTKFPSTTMTKNIPSHCMNTPRNPPVHRNTPMTHYAILNNLA